MHEAVKKKSFIGALANSGSLPAAIIRSTQNNKRCYFVVLFRNQSNMEKINKDAKLHNKPMNLTDYGLIIAKGYGENPTDEDKKKIWDQYGIDIKKLFT
ncbi:conserved hypothetical protein [Candidatus Xenohaliotis californiensis]|uniref:Uncharacterized protein n=1 Tax=Candidatus Xenohaliotis californiensis TaxID=84677 RepID=A0ABP0EXJ2_9RICK|nr:conserved hypothetical protein [Candidatus Xenohaliotis californiensis]